MKRIILFLVLFLLVSSVGLADGLFRGFESGDSVEHLEEEFDVEFEKIQDPEDEDAYSDSYGVDAYEIKDDTLSLGNFKLTQLVYGFFKDALLNIYMTFDTSIEKEKLVDLFVAKYGDDYEKDKDTWDDSVTYYWVDKEEIIMVSYEKTLFSEKTERVDARIIDVERYRKLLSWQEEQQEKQAEEQSEDW